MTFTEAPVKHLSHSVAGPIVKRLAPLGRDTVSFAVKTIDHTVVFDAPHTRALLQQEKQLTSVFLSHEHPDHADTDIETGKVDVPTWIHPLAYPILMYLGKDIQNKYPQIDFVGNKDSITIDGFGTVTALRLSHNTPTMLGYYILLNSGQSIVYCADHRDGNLTDSACESLEFLRKSHGKADLLIADMTGFGIEQHLSLSQQIKHMEDAMKDGRRQHKPTFIFIKPGGDYGLLLYWMREGVFQGKEVYVPPKLYQLFGEMAEIEPTWAKLRSLTHPLQSSEQLEEHDHAIYIFDEMYDVKRKHIPHVLINSTWKQLPRVGTHEVPTYDLPIPGHTRSSFEQIYAAVNPKFLAVSHPGNSWYREWLRKNHAHLILSEKNTHIDLDSRD